MENNRLLIATHNSATGERSGSLLSWLLLPFARCQSKSLKKQYDAGCRMFDIRIRWVKDSWRCAHGPWYTKKEAHELLEIINRFPEPCYVCITYEGILKPEDKEDFITFCHWCKSAFPYIYFGPVATKYSDKDAKVDWVNLLPGDKFYKNKQGFIPLDGKHWQTYFPIPWLWNLIYTRKHKFDTESFTFVDFL